MVPDQLSQNPLEDLIKTGSRVLPLETDSGRSENWPALVFIQMPGMIWIHVGMAGSAARADRQASWHAYAHMCHLPPRALTMPAHTNSSRRHSRHTHRTSPRRYSSHMHTSTNSPADTHHDAQSPPVDSHHTRTHDLPRRHSPHTHTRTHDLPPRALTTQLGTGWPHSTAGRPETESPSTSHTLLSPPQWTL